MIFFATGGGAFDAKFDPEKALKVKQEEKQSIVRASRCKSKAGMEMMIVVTGVDGDEDEREQIQLRESGLGDDQENGNEEEDDDEKTENQSLSNARQVITSVSVANGSDARSYRA